MTDDIQTEIGLYDESSEQGNETLSENEETSDESTTSEPEKAEKSKEFQTILAQKEHFKKKYEALKEKFGDVTPKREAKSDDWRERVDFLLVNRDFNKQEFDHISAVSKRDGISLQEAAEKEMDYISFRRQKTAEENKIPSSSAAKGSSLRKTDADIRKMTSAELQAYEAQLDKAEEGGEI
jgi:hypothetical protein